MQLLFYKKVPVLIFPSFFILIKKLFKFSFRAVTIFPFIIIDSKKIFEDKFYMNHEYIHILQYIETGIIGFYLISLYEFLCARIYLKKSFLGSYYYMAVEQEAHRNDKKLSYPEERECFSVFKYLRTKNKVHIVNEGGKRIIC